ncbi:MAG: competence protein ComEA [Psychroserpens sp.]|jgi:competence protein ComEA
MYKKFKMWLRFFFGFSRMEANGFVVLSLLMVFFLMLPLLTKHFIFSTRVERLPSSKSVLLDSLIIQLNAAILKEEVISSLPLFDLNEINAAALAEYGVPQFLADRIVKYRSNVNPFRQKSDLLKIYGLDSALYKKLLPYVLEIKNIPEKGKRNYSDVVYEKPVYQIPFKKFNSENPRKLASFDINTADSTQLKLVFGIGPAYAKRIVAFRELLGGFYDTRQLAEVYGLESPALDSLLVYADVRKPIVLILLFINDISEKDLSKHPYISYKQAKLIIAYRNQHGNYLKATDLLQIGIFDSLFVEKVSPYLHFEE